MDLFDNFIEQPIGILPKDGSVEYYGALISYSEASLYYESLFKDIYWKNDEAVVYGKRIITKRKVAWYADKPFDYTYSNTTKRALPWNGTLLALKALVEKKLGEEFNSCLLNLYHDGSEGMAWHSDAEDALKKNGVIASLSLGAERKFGFKHKHTKETVYLNLQAGSLLVMKGETQRHWMHRLPPTKMVNEPRINLTFRMMEETS